MYISNCHVCITVRKYMQSTIIVKYIYIHPIYVIFSKYKLNYYFALFEFFNKS